MNCFHDRIKWLIRTDTKKCMIKYNSWKMLFGLHSSCQFIPSSHEGIFFDTFYLSQSDSSKSTSWANRWMFMFRKTWSFLGIQNLTGKKPESTNFSKLVAVMSSSKPEPRLIDKNSFLKFQLSLTFNFAINICAKWSIFHKKYILLKKNIFGQKTIFLFVHFTIVHWPCNHMNGSKNTDKMLLLLV